MNDLPSFPTPPRPDDPHASKGTGFGDAELQNVHAQLLRRKESNGFGFLEISLVLVLLSIGIIISAEYLIENSGGFDPMVYDETMAQGGVVMMVEPPFDAMLAGENFYKVNCIVCHQPNGGGIPGAFPPLVESEWVSGNEDRLASILLNGLSGPITVNGAQYFSVMPPLNQFSDRELASVLTFVRQSFGNHAAPVSEEKVAEIRARHGDRPAPWSPEELLKLYPME